MYEFEQLLRWIHVIAGVMWIGILYFFNFVNAPLVAKLDAATKKAVVPELMPRALFWFRWGAAWTWITDVLMLIMIFYAYDGVNLFEGDSTWGGGALASICLVFGAVFIYDLLMSSELFGDAKIKNSVAFVLTAIILMIMVSSGLSARGYMIHIGTMFGSIMAFNVWFRIWPAQQQIIAAVKNGEAPPDGLPALAGGRSKHNTYLSVPLIWTMLNSHTAVVTFFGMAQWAVLLIVILVGWHVVFQFYKKSASIEGF